MHVQVPILFALSEAQLFELARCMGSATFKAGQLVFRKGDPGIFLRAAERLCSCVRLRQLASSLRWREAWPAPASRPASWSSARARKARSVCKSDPRLLAEHLSEWSAASEQQAAQGGRLQAGLEWCQPSSSVSKLQTACRASASAATSSAYQLPRWMQKLAHLTSCACVCAGDMFYVIEEGSFTVFNEQDQELARVGKGSCFGELALLRQVQPGQVYSLRPAKAAEQSYLQQQKRSARKDEVQQSCSSLPAPCSSRL